VSKTKPLAEPVRAHPLESKLGLPAGRQSSRATGSALPEEGAALIRAFLQIEQREVRVAILDLITRLSSLNSGA
jgi:hypothetical protein